MRFEVRPKPPPVLDVQCPRARAPARPSGGSMGDTDAQSANTPPPTSSLMMCNSHPALHVPASPHPRTPAFHPVRFATSPNSLTSGPPELPGLMAVSGPRVGVMEISLGTHALQVLRAVLAMQRNAQSTHRNGQRLCGMEAGGAEARWDEVRSAFWRIPIAACKGTEPIGSRRCAHAMAETLRNGLQCGWSRAEVCIAKKRIVGRNFERTAFDAGAHLSRRSGETRDDAERDRRVESHRIADRNGPVAHLRSAGDGRIGARDRNRRMAGSGQLGALDEGCAQMRPTVGMVGHLRGR
eukprot:scaffold18012_cov117-Isochrysis_galbana.AAC.3